MELVNNDSRLLIVAIFYRNIMSISNTLVYIVIVADVVSVLERKMKNERVNHYSQKALKLKI